MVICSQVSCGDPPAISNANVTKTGSVYPYSAVYTCHPGYFLSSTTSSKTCKIDASWSTDEVTCSQLRCEYPDLLDNAYLLSPKRISDSFRNGVVGQIYCIDEFSIVAMNSSADVVKYSSITCEDGNWTAPNPEVLCVPENCGYPAAIPFTTWTLEAGNPQRVAYQCIEGYKMVAATPRMNASSYIFEVDCNSVTGWSLPTNMQDICRPVDCGEILTPTNSPLDVRKCGIFGVVLFVYYFGNRSRMILYACQESLSW